MAIFKHLPDKCAKDNTNIQIACFMFIGAALLLLYGYINIHSGSNPRFGIAITASGIILIISGLYLILSHNFTASTRLTLVVFMCLYAVMLITGGSNRNAMIWIMIIPLISFYTQGSFGGFLCSVIFSLYTLFIMYLKYYTGLDTPFMYIEYLEMLLALALFSVMTFMYENARYRNEEQIKNQIIFNTLTGLPNRTKLLDDLNNISERVLFLINVDDFKEINDLYGSETGDLVIIEISRRLADMKKDFPDLNVYKLHADEFALMIPGETGHDNPEIIAKRIIRSISEDININGSTIAVSVSIGISDSKRDLLADTDIALKSAKKSRRQYIFFDSSMKVAEQYQQNIERLHVLKKGITEDRIVPFFQPIISNLTGKIEKFECLVRLVSDNGIVFPSSFLELSKRAKIYPAITRSMIRKSFEIFRQSDKSFSLNLSLDDLLDNDTTSFILSQIDSYRNGGNVIFELVESDRIEDCKEVRDFISNVKARGCRIAIDDFGSGYSNFDFILRLNADFLKIDASLIRKIDSDRNSQIVTETIVDFSKKLNIRTIAEFVHNETIYNKVRELGIDYSQGFYFGEPDSRLPSS